jgi:hypothetical protein
MPRERCHPEGFEEREMIARTRKSRRIAFALCLALLATACGDYGGGGSTGGSGTPGPGPGPGPGPAPGPSDAEMEAAFTQTVHPIVTQYCIDCHAGAGPGTPHIASPDPATGYREVWYNQKVSLANPSTSRLVRRLVADFHHCWSDCVADAAQMQAAIEQWALLVDFNSGGGQNVQGLVSENLTLADGFEDQGQDRYAENLVALWEFKDLTGTTALDTSGVVPAADLTLEGPTLMSSYGIRVETGRAIATQAASRKLYDLLAEPSDGTQQYTLEAWIANANTTQEGPAPIVSYAGGGESRNFGLGQVTYYYNVRTRTVNPELNGNGNPALQTADADRDAQATLQHVVITYDRYRGRRAYVNGAFTGDLDEYEPFPLWNWSENHRIVMGNEISNDRQWQGSIRLVAVYKFALSDAQILQNFNAGVGKRILMRFDVSRWAGAGTYIEFVVSELDDYSYLFCQPSFHAPNVTNARVGKLRVMVNGQSPVSGQGFVNVDTVVTGTDQQLSPLCSVIQKDQGPLADVFTIDFEYLANFQSPKPPPPIPPLPPRQFGDPQPIEGLRDFRRVNESMAAVTGVSPNAPSVLSTYQELAVQLPGTYDLRTFASSQQVAVTKLSLEYCDALVETPNLRSAFFGNVVDFAAPATSAFSSQATRDALIQLLIDRILGANLATQPDMTDVQPILDGLIGDLTAGCTPATCDAVRTRTIVKSLCSAALASAAASIH